MVQGKEGKAQQEAERPREEDEEHGEEEVPTWMEVPKVHQSTALTTRCTEVVTASV